jgi:hypothetical protein
MPLSISVGLSHKASRNYQSNGVFINLTAEMDPLLLHDADELQRRIHELYEQAATGLHRRAELARIPLRQPSPQTSPRPAENDGNDRAGPPPESPRDRTIASPVPSTVGEAMTPRQRRALLAIAGRGCIDPDFEARSQFGVGFEALTLKQASALIDRLKGHPQRAGENGR